jgi:hypothetical protein
MAYGPRLGSRLTVVALLSLAGTATCLCPPCPEDASAAGPNGVPALPSGSRLVVWDGDGHGIEGGKSWADCGAKPDCSAKLSPAKRVGHNRTHGLVYRAKGPEWNGFGWNWFGWYPEDSGTDIRGYDRVRFWIKIEAKSKEAAPEPGGLAFALGCSQGKKTSANAVLAKYADDLLDGQWHDVIIPLADLYIGKEGAMFDPGSAWEFRLSSWSPTARDFTIILDDVAFEKS